jgi:isopenicillin N synthase-like dioxygenase
LEILAGRYRATPHRVRNLAHHDRYSFPYFFDPNFSASLQPIDEKLLAHHRKLEKRERWDQVDMEDVEKITYGDYVLGKVLKVFPQLADAAAVAKPGASVY